MKPHLLTLCLFATALCLRASAQSYSIDWYKIAGGGGTSTGAVYSISGTIGQSDASQLMTGGNYTLTAGFWSLVGTVQTLGAPLLSIVRQGAGVTVCWQNVSGWNLQQNSNLAGPGGWSAATGVTTNNGTNCLNLPLPAGNIFFRLHQQ